MLTIIFVVECQELRKHHAVEDIFRVGPANNLCSETTSTVEEVKVVCLSVQKLLVLIVTIGRMFLLYAVE